MIHIAYHLRHDAAPRDQIHAQWPHLREGETDPRRNLVALRPIVAFTFTDEFVVLVEHDHRLRESTLQRETHSGGPILQVLHCIAKRIQRAALQIVVTNFLNRHAFHELGSQ